MAAGGAMAEHAVAARVRDAGTPNTSAKMFMKRGLLEPPPETTNIAQVISPSSLHMASTFCFIVKAIASRIER